MSVFGKIAAVLVVIAASIYGYQALAANAVEASGCCCGTACECESCDGCDCSSGECTCEGCECSGGECDGSCPADAA